MADILIATETFTTEVDGVPQVIQKGVTRVRAGHPLAEQNPDYFEPADRHIHFDVEQATKAPGEKRGTKKK